MRALLTFSMGLVALLLAIQSANAGFSFSFSEASANVVIGSSVQIDVIATDTAAANAALSFFTVGSVTPSVSGTGVANFTFSEFPVLPDYTASNMGKVIGQITATASPTAQLGQYAELTLTFNGVNGNFGGSIGDQGNIRSSSLRITAVPEPSSLVLVGLASVVSLIRRRQK